MLSASALCACNDDQDGPLPRGDHTALEDASAAPGAVAAPSLDASAHHASHADPAHVAAADAPPLDGAVHAPPEATALAPARGHEQHAGASHDPELRCHVLRATAGSAGPYVVRADAMVRVRFTAPVPWRGAMYVRSIRPRIENSQVVRHALYDSLSPQSSASALELAEGARDVDGALLYGGSRAAGSEGLTLPANVGLGMAGSTYVLELLYDNRGGAPLEDQSGIELCVSPTRPEQLAGITLLGTATSAGTSVSGQCEPRASQPIHLLSGHPHMHARGRHMKVAIQRRDGRVETIHDAPYRAEAERTYALDATLEPGESLTTTCTYEPQASIGSAESAKECLFFTSSWPAGLLLRQRDDTLLYGHSDCFSSAR